MEFETSISEEYSDVFDDIGEEDMSMEESVLVELQTLTVQVPNLDSLKSFIYTVFLLLEDA